MARMVKPQLDVQVVQVLAHSERVSGCDCNLLTEDNPLLGLCKPFQATIVLH